MEVNNKTEYLYRIFFLKWIPPIFGQQKKLSWNVDEIPQTTHSTCVSTPTLWLWIDVKQFSYWSSQATNRETNYFYNHLAFTCLWQKGVIFTLKQDLRCELLIIIIYHPWKQCTTLYVAEKDHTNKADVMPISLITDSWNNYTQCTSLSNK